MQRQIIRIDAERCDGCSKCISGCPEGAIQLIQGKARVVSESTCDGLGACIAQCPSNAISIETREAAAYDEIETLKRILEQGPDTLRAHLTHLYDHAQANYLEQALTYLQQQALSVPDYKPQPMASRRSLPTLNAPNAGAANSRVAVSREAPEGPQSQLSQWPIQLHLIQPRNPTFVHASVLLAADCVGFALPDFNQKYLPGKRLLVACPKLDRDQDVYLSKLVALIDEAEITSLDVLIMEVPCCGGLVRLANEALRQSKRQVPLRTTVVARDGQVMP